MEKTRASKIQEKIVVKVTPPPLRPKVIEAIEEGQSQSQLRRMVRAIVKGRMRLSFNSMLVTAQAVALFLPFAGTEKVVASSMFVLLSLTVFCFCDAYSYPPTGDFAQVFLDSVIAATVMFVVQIIMKRWTPSLSLSGEFVIRGISVGLLTVSTMRLMLLRTSIGLSGPAGGGDWSGDELKRRSNLSYSATSRLSLLFGIASMGLCATNPEVMPGLMASHGMIFGALPIPFMALAFRFQKPTISGAIPFDWITLFGDHNAKVICMKLGMLWDSEKRGGLSWYRLFEFLAFAFLLMPPIVALVALLTGRGAEVDTWRLSMNLPACLVMTAIWPFVREANETTARILREELKFSEA